MERKGAKGPPGVCALCGATATLISSHYLAAAFSRRLHTETGGKTLPPISLDAERAIYNCRQPQAKLLCDVCEHRFKVQGEDWVIECTCQKDLRFPLRDLLLRSTAVEQIGPTSAGRQADVYCGSRVPALRHAEIIYFAASVFWRGWVFDWSRVSDHAQVELPPGLGLEFRNFLLGKSPFPTSVILHVEVALNPVFSSGDIGMTFPDKIVPRVPSPDLTARGYAFTVFGVTFLLYFDLGRSAGLLHGRATSIAEPPHRILLTDVRMSEVDEVHNKLASTAKRVGRLARS